MLLKDQGKFSFAFIASKMATVEKHSALDIAIQRLDLNTIIILALIAGLSIACLSIGVLVWAFVADRLIRDSEARKTLIEWIKSKLRKGS